MGFFSGVIILVHSVIQGSFWVLSEAQRIFLGFDFLPPFDHPHQLKPGVCNPLGLTCYLTCKELIWSASSNEYNVLIANKS